MATVAISLPLYVKADIPAPLLSTGKTAEPENEPVKPLVAVTLSKVTLPVVVKF